MTGDSSAISDTMHGLQAGERQSLGHLFETLYPELRRMAAARMKRERAGHSWQPTLLVNELYLEMMKHNLQGQNRPELADRSAFLGLAGFLMKRLLILHSRPLRQRVDHVNVEDWAEPVSAVPSPETLQFVEALLAKLEGVDPKLRTVVELRVFEGRSYEEIAGVLQCSTRTVGSYWAFARRMIETDLTSNA
jgi:RNA polymerase sigma factor (TIGR02999 family)